jgi:VCBS repeat-containing protein
MFGAREWADNETAVRAYWQALQTVPRDPSSGEVAAGTGSDTRLAVGARSNPAQLELSGLETLVVNVDGQPLTLGAAPWWLSGDDTGSTTEDVPAHASGVLRFIELDAGDLPVVSTRTETGQALGSLSAQLAPASGGGPGALNWTYSLTPSPALDALPAGAIVHETYTVRLLDAQGHALERTIAIDVQGRNDAPTVAGTQVAVTMYEDFPPASGVVRASDPDTGTVFSFNGSSTSPIGRFDVDAGNGEWRFTLDPVNAQAMAMGDSVRLDQVVLVSDGAGGSAQQL